MNMIRNFETFKDGITEIVHNIPELSEFIGEDKEENAVILNLMENIKKQVPSVYNPNYPAVCAFSINYKEVGFKTPGYLAFGWKILINNDKITYSFRVTVMTINKFAKQPEAIEVLKQAGWRVSNSITQRTA